MVYDNGKGKGLKDLNGKVKFEPETHKKESFLSRNTMVPISI